MFRILGFVIISLAFSSGFAQQPDGLQKTADDDDRQFTNVGNVGLTVTNFGTIGTRNAYWPTQPSCEYPRGSRVEHIYQGGLWVGAFSRNRAQFLVTTGTSDQVSSRRTTGGFEFTNELGARIVRRSSLAFSAEFAPGAVSHQDFASDYSDLNTRVPASGDTIPFHNPLGITVHQESYAWNFPFADFFVILNYTIHNVSPDTLDSVYVGFWTNNVVRNTNLVRPGTPGYFDHGGTGFDSLQRMAFSFDYDGIPGGPPANSYIAIKLLGTSPFPNGIDSLADLATKTYLNAWQFRSSTAIPPYLSPTDDYLFGDYRGRYQRLTQSMPRANIDFLRTTPGNFSFLLSTGPMGGDSLGYSKLSMYPGDSMTVVFAVICANRFPFPGSGLTRDTATIRRQTLYTNAGWSQRAYNGEDLNGNNVLDLGEDIVGRSEEFGLVYLPDGKLTRFLLPFPPRQPKVHADVENQKVVIYWDKSTAEESIDPITGQRDFEGYRIYRSNPGADFQSPETFLLDLPQAGEFDVPGNSVGYNTGFSQIVLDSAKYFPGDTVAYWYQFPPLSTYLSESFETAWTNGGTIPEGWTRTSVLGTAEWGQQVNPLLGQSPPVFSKAHHGAAAAWFATNVTTGSTTRLESPSVDLRVAATARVKFYYVNSDGVDQLRVRVSTDAGNTWTTLATLTTTASNTWQQQNVDLESVLGRADVKIGFEAVADGGTSDIWVDNILVQSKGVEVPHLNGWQYVYGVSAFDRGDSANALPSLESARVLRRVVPGTPPTSNAPAEVKVYPNPYYASAFWDGSGERNRKIYFYNLPAQCEIRIYTLAGDIVATINHDANTYSGSDIQWFATHGDPQTSVQFAGGEHAWDLITNYDQAIATGLYLFSVKDKATGDVKRGKFLVIK